MRAKKIFSLIIVVALMVGFNLTADTGKEKYEEKFEKTVSLDKDGKVSVANIAGDIEVKTWDKAQVKIEAIKISKNDSMEKAKENADLVKIEVIEEGNYVEITTKYPKIKGKSINVSVQFWLTVPSNASATAKSVSGNVYMEKIKGDAKGGSVSGKITMMDISGTCKGTSVSGNVNVEKAQKGVYGKSTSGNVEIQDVNGDVDASSVSGNIVVENISGSIEAETVSGGVTLMNVSNADEIKAKALSGSVKYEGDISSSGRYSFNSHSGRVTLMIPGSSKFDLEAKSFSGSINSDFDIMVSGKFGKEFRGSVNGGGADIVVKTFSGSIYLKKK